MKWLVRNLVEMVATWLVTIFVAAFVAWFQEILRQEKELARLEAMNEHPAIRGKHAKR